MRFCYVMELKGEAKGRPRKRVSTGSRPPPALTWVSQGCLLRRERGMPGRRPTAVLTQGQCVQVLSPPVPSTEVERQRLGENS